MEFSDKNEFTKEFFQRTVYNLKLYNNGNKLYKERFQYEVTQLINSLLGLIVFVKEDRTSFSSIDLNDIVNIEDITWNYCHRDGGKLEDKNFSNFIRHIRNAISHKRLSIKSDETRSIKSIVFTDKNRNNKFRVELDIAKIHILVKKLSECL